MEGQTDPFVFWDEMVRVATVLANDQMAHVLERLPVYPAQGAPAELGDHGVVHVPSLKVDSAPHPALFVPQGPHALKHESTGIEI